jgi:hypothetical protein
MHSSNDPAIGNTCTGQSNCVSLFVGLLQWLIGHRATPCRETHKRSEPLLMVDELKISSNAKLTPKGRAGRRTARRISACSECIFNNPIPHTLNAVLRVSFLRVFEFLLGVLSHPSLNRLETSSHHNIYHDPITITMLPEHDSPQSKSNTYGDCLRVRFARV